MKDPKRTHLYPSIPVCISLYPSPPSPTPLPDSQPYRMDLPSVQDFRHFVIDESRLQLFLSEGEPRPAESGEQGEGAEEECVCSHWDNERRLPLLELRFIICSPSSAWLPAPLTGSHYGQSAASRADQRASQSPHCIFPSSSPLLPILLPSLSSSLCLSHSAHPPTSTPVLPIFSFSLSCIATGKP